MPVVTHLSLVSRVAWEASHNAVQIVTQNQQPIMMPSYIEETANGIFIVFEKLVNPGDFQKSLESWFWNNMYIDWLNIQAIEWILFGNIPHEDKVRIGNSLKTIDTDLLWMFWESIQIWNDGRARWTYFHRRDLLEHPALKDLSTEDEKLTRIRDMAIAQSWKPGQNRSPIRYWFRPEFMLESLKRKSNMSIVIAEPKVSTVGNDAYIVEVLSWKNTSWREDTRVKMQLDKGSVNQREVDAWEILYKKMPATQGEAGIDVSGFPKPGTTGKDAPFSYDPESISSEDLEDTTTIFRAKTSGFLYKNESGRLEIRPSITVEAVGMKWTGGSIEIHQNSIDVEWDITKDIESAYQIKTQWNISGANVYADDSIDVTWSIVWSGKTFVSWNKGRVTIHEVGRAKAGGRITVGKNVENAYISSKNETFTFWWYLAWSHVSAQKIIWRKAVGSIMVGNSVILEEARDCVIIANSVTITHAWDNVTIVFILPDITYEIHQLARSISDLEKEALALETKYKEALVSWCKSLKGNSLTKEDITKCHSLVVKAAPLYMKENPTKEDLVEKWRYSSSLVPRLAEVYNKLQKVKIDIQERHTLLKYTENIPKMVGDAVDISLKHIHGNVSLQEHTLPTQEDIRNSSEDKQQIFSRIAQWLPWKKYTINWSSFFLRGVK